MFPRESRALRVCLAVEAAGNKFAIKIPNCEAEIFEVQFGFPVNDITSTTFGRINGTATQYAPRTVQVVLRYRY